MHRESPPSRVAKMAVRTREAAEESVASVWYVSLSVARAASPEAPARIIWATVSTHPGISSCRPGVPPVPPRTHNLTKDVVAGVSQGVGGEATGCRTCSSVQALFPPSERVT